MKSRLVLSLACVAAAVVALAAFRPVERGIHESLARVVDDPPPEPMDCPLCGGDPVLHMRRLAQISWLDAQLAFGLIYRRW